MINLDDSLQVYLSEVEKGVPLEKVLEDLPPEDRELAPLIHLAVNTRDLNHPQLSSFVAGVHQARLTGVSHIHSKSNNIRLASWLEMNWKKLAVGGGLTAAMAALLILVVSAIGLGVYAVNAANAHHAQLTGISGLVQVASSENSTDWQLLSADTTVNQGERIQTYEDSGATLVFKDGSRTLLGPKTDVTLTTLDSGLFGSIKLLLTQNSGVTDHAVIPLKGSGSYFKVNTPSGLVSVHGTAFNVAIDDSGRTIFSVVHGRVQVQADHSQVFLTSGQATTALTGSGLENPAYQFALKGPVSAMSDTQWTVAGVKFAVTTQTKILGSFQIGTLASVRGLIQSNGDWVATSIEPADDDGTRASFTGVIQSKPDLPGTWVISGQNVLVNQTTQLSKNLVVGTAVKVTFSVLPGQAGWLAVSISALEDEEKPTVTPTQTQTLTKTTTGTGTITPKVTATEEHTQTITATSTGTTTLTPTVTGTLPTATTTVTPKATITRTPALTFTPTPTEIVKNENSRCDNRTKQQPEALRLAQRYQVSYDEIIGWFCRGFGFGEIDLAYQLSHSSGKTVDSIFAMRASGLGWGEIRKQLQNQIPPASTTPEPKNNNGNGNGKH